ncbi:MAG: hypothetical protein ABIA93_05335, partial [Candidatus Woesearchaeota archaeon]
LAESDTGSPIIAVAPADNGMLIYYGIDDMHSGFKTTPYYPIFWKRLLDYATKTPSVQNLNYRTGSLVSLGPVESIKTPKSTVRDSKLVLDYQGTYELPDRTIVANLNSPQESDVNGVFVTQRARSLEQEKTPATQPKDLITYGVLAIFIVLFLELLYLKFRGDT